MTTTSVSQLVMFSTQRSGDSVISHLPSVHCCQGWHLEPGLPSLESSLGSIAETWSDHVPIVFIATPICRMASSIDILDSMSRLLWFEASERHCTPITVKGSTWPGHPNQTWFTQWTAAFFNPIYRSTGW